METKEEKIILEGLHKLWKHHAAHLKDSHQRKENPMDTIITIVENCSPVMGKNQGIKNT